MALEHLAGPFRFEPPYKAAGKTYFVFNVFADEDQDGVPVLLSQGWTDAQIRRGEHKTWLQQRQGLNRFRRVLESAEDPDSSAQRAGATGLLVGSLGSSTDPPRFVKLEPDSEGRMTLLTLRVGRDGVFYNLTLRALAAWKAEEEG